MVRDRAAIRCFLFFPFCAESCYGTYAVYQWKVWRTVTCVLNISCGNVHAVNRRNVVCFLAWNPSTVSPALCAGSAILVLFFFCFCFFTLLSVVTNHSWMIFFLMTDYPDLKMFTFNANGLGEFRKRKDVFDCLKKQNWNVFLLVLQETHWVSGMDNIAMGLWLCCCRAWLWK